MPRGGWCASPHRTREGSLKSCYGMELYNASDCFKTRDISICPDVILAPPFCVFHKISTIEKESHSLSDTV